MVRQLLAGLLLSGSLLTGAPLGAETGSITIRATVPVYCQLGHSAAGAGALNGNAFTLGQLNEYCNAPGGYQIVVNYTPGTLNGAVIMAGEDQIILNGSGQAVLSQALGPRIRTRSLVAVPGAAGFDTDRLDFRIQLV